MSDGIEVEQMVQERPRKVKQDFNFTFYLIFITFFFV